MTPIERFVSSQGNMCYKEISFTKRIPCTTTSMRWPRTKPISDQRGSRRDMWSSLWPKIGSVKVDEPRTLLAFHASRYLRTTAKMWNLSVTCFGTQKPQTWPRSHLLGLAISQVGYRHCWSIPTSQMRSQALIGSRELLHQVAKSKTIGKNLRETGHWFRLRKHNLSFWAPGVLVTDNEK